MISNIFDVESIGWKALVAMFFDMEAQPA